MLRVCYVYSFKIFLASIRQLLRTHLHPLRTILPLPKHPLVLRQVTHDRIQSPTIQRSDPPRRLLLLSSSLGNLSVLSSLSRCLESPWDCLGLLNHAFLLSSQSRNDSSKHDPLSIRVGKVGTHALCWSTACSLVVGHHLSNFQSGLDWFEFLLVQEDDRCC